MNIHKVYILTACHNEIERVLALLNDLSKQDYQDMQLVVVNADSQDGTKQTILAKYPNTKLLSVGEDNWWTGSLAKGIEWILREAQSTDYIITINADCRVNENFVSKLVAAATIKKDSIIGSVIVDQDSSRLVDAAVKLDWSSSKFSQYLPKSTKSDYLISDVLSTKGTIYPVKAFLDAGNFDTQHLPHYLSDYEFSLRASRYGYHLLTYSSSKVLNDANRTGIGESLPTNLSLSKLWELLFSRRSKQNIIDHFQFIRLAAPPNYRLKNYLNLLIKSAYLVASIYPFGYITTWLLKVRKVRNHQS